MTTDGLPVLSRYRIIRRLGAGGMGEVYLAEDTTLNRPVALKVLPPAHTQDHERLQRFKQEAKAASSLNHPNILTIYEVGDTAGQHYIATEFVEGETLRELLNRVGRMEIRALLNVAVQAASALAAAHEAGIVHRDVKPENIMLRRDGYVKVLDFGLAKLTEAALPSGATTITSPAYTAAGVVLGTAQYMSPEQASGARVDARTDIFALGAVLYELMTGEPAFRGASVMATLAAIINQEPRPLPSNVRPKLSDLVLRCLRKDPSRRYQTMADLKAALEDLREESLAPQRVGGFSRWQWMSVAAALILVIAAIASWRPWRQTETGDPLRATALTTLPGVELHPSISPDGNQVVFAWSGPNQDNQDLYVQMIGSGNPLRLTNDPRSDYNPVWSPDGKSIAYLRSPPPSPAGARSRELRIIPPLGGPDRKLAETKSQDFAGGLYPDAVYLAWAPDGHSVVVTDSLGEGRPDALFAVSVESGEKRQLTNPQPTVLADTSPALSSDGRWLAFLRRSSWGAGELHVVALGQGLTASGEPRRLTSEELRADYPAWTPDGREIVFSAAGSLWKVPVTGARAPARIPYIGEEGSMPAIAAPRPGQPARLIYVRSFADSNVWRIDTTAPGAPSSSPPVKIAGISSTKPEYHVDFSPDGARIAFISVRSGTPEVWLARADGSDAVKLTSMKADTNCPVWSPDGRSIGFSSTLSREFDVYTVPSEGGKPRRLTEHAGLDLCPTFSRDGKWIYFISTRSGDYRLWKMPAAGGDAVQVTPTQSSRGYELPDGTSVFYAAFAIESPVWRLSTAGGEPVKVLDGISWFNLCLVDKGAYYIDRIGGKTRLRFLDYATGKSTTVADNLGDVTSGLTATRDGRTILFTRVDSSADDLMLVENFR